MDENNESFVYGKAKVVGKVFDERVHFVTLLDKILPFTLVYQEGKTEYSPDYYKVLYGSSCVGIFDDCSQVLISPDGKYVIYVIEKDGKHYLYRNDKNLKGPVEKFGDIEFSDNSKDFGCFLEKDGMWELHENNTIYREKFDEQASLVYLADGSLAFLGKKDDIWNYYTTTKGKLPISFSKVGLLLRSPVSEQMAFFTAKSLNGKWLVYINDKEALGPFDSMGMPVAISSSGNNHAYTVVKEKEWYIYINDKKIDRAFGSIDYLSFLPNNKDIVCSEIKPDGARIYINEKLIAGPFEKLGFEIVFSPDCKRMYYSQRNDGKWSIGHTDIDDPEMKYIKDIDVTLPCFEVIKLLVYPDLSRIIYSVASDINNTMSLDTIVSLGDLGTFGIFQMVLFMQISKDGSTIAFVAKEEKDWFVYVNGKKVAGPFFGISMLFFYQNTSIIKYQVFMSETSLPIFMLYMDGKNYVGQIDKDKIVYVDGDDIVLKERICNVSKS